MVAIMMVLTLIIVIKIIMISAPLLLIAYLITNEVI